MAELAERVEDEPIPFGDIAKHLGETALGGLLFVDAFVSSGPNLLRIPAALAALFIMSRSYISALNDTLPPRQPK